MPFLVPKNIENKARKSGYDFVCFIQDKRRSKDSVPYQANKGARQKGNTGWKGPRRTTALEAAQDYCDYVNGPDAFMVIDDLRNDKRKSGFDHVQAVNAGGTRRTSGGPRKAGFRAAVYGGKRDAAGHAFQGPLRSTAEEAAQDYCDYVNGLGIQPVQLKRIERPSSTTKAVTEVTDEERELRARLRLLERERTEGRLEYVYLIGEKGSDYGVKVGYSVDPEGRPFGLQTGNPRELVLLGYIEGGKGVEASLHQRYIKDNLVNEWFIPSHSLFSEFGVDYAQWRRSLQGQIEAPESIAA